MLSVENKYWVALSEEEQRRWRLPPAAPAFCSQMLRQDSLSALATAVLAASSVGSTGGSCSGVCAWIAVTTLGLDPVTLKWAWRPADKQVLAHIVADAVRDGRRHRLSRSIVVVGGGAGWQRWVMRLGAAAWAPLGSWLGRAPAVLPVAARSRSVRQVAGAGKWRGRSSRGCPCL